MKRFTVLLVAIAVAWGTFSFADFAGSGFSGPPFQHGTLTTTKYCIYTAGVGIVCNSDGGGGTSYNQSLNTSDSPTFFSVTLGPGGLVSTCSAANGQCGSTTVNAGAAADNILQAGLSWTDNAMQCYRTRNNDNTINYSVGCMTKAFPLIIDNVVATDNALLFLVPRAITLLRADCYASVDNVVGSLMECSTSDVTSCTVLDAWTVTNAVNPFTDSTMTDGAVAAGAWLRWSTTSVGTASVNRLTCTVQYRE